MTLTFDASQSQMLLCSDSIFHLYMHLFILSLDCFSYMDFM